LKLCKSPGDAKYAGLAVDWFQEKGFDFSEELNSIFVRVCVDGGRPEIAAERFVYAKGRIGSWSTPSSLLKLLTALKEKESFESIIQVTHTITPKGVRPNVNSFEIVLEACVKANSKDNYDTTVTLAQNILTSEEVQNLIQKIPFASG
jgi:hypothetical protein